MSEPKETELKPCKCGGQGKYGYLGHGDDTGNRTLIRLSCDYCRFETEEYELKHLATEAWNKRQEPKSEKWSSESNSIIEDLDAVKDLRERMEEPKPDQKLCINPECGYMVHCNIFTKCDQVQKPGLTRLAKKGDYGFSQALITPEPSGWVSIDTPPPKFKGNESEKVLVIDINGNHDEATYDHFYKNFQRENSQRGARITHWQPLPEPPKEKEEAQYVGFSKKVIGGDKVGVIAGGIPILKKE